MKTIGSDMRVINVPHLQVIFEIKSFITNHGMATIIESRYDDRTFRIVTGNNNLSCITIYAE